MELLVLGLYHIFFWLQPSTHFPLPPPSLHPSLPSFIPSSLSPSLHPSLPSSLPPPSLPFLLPRGYLAVVEDYVPEVLKGFSRVLVYLLTAGAFSGLMYLNIKDVGICGAVRAVWTL